MQSHTSAVYYPFCERYTFVSFSHCIRDILTGGVVCTGAYGRMVSSVYRSSPSFMRHKYVVLLFKIWRSKMAKPRNDATKQAHFAACAN